MKFAKGHGAHIGPMRPHKAPRRNPRGAKGRESAGLIQRLGSVRYLANTGTTSLLWTSNLRLTP
ncbi:MAG TPA: hypothetical protein VFO27_19785, partial [Bryobacteraceae bacterium]|nr:hypothetical protein [Bryobacteraceae bacterium]